MPAKLSVTDNFNVGLLHEFSTFDTTLEAGRARADWLAKAAVVCLDHIWGAPRNTRGHPRCPPASPPLLQGEMAQVRWPQQRRPGPGWGGSVARNGTRNSTPSMAAC
eukprot:jgi/Mesen1/10938/ME000095S10269